MAFMMLVPHGCTFIHLLVSLGKWPTFLPSHLDKCTPRLLFTLINAHLSIQV